MYYYTPTPQPHIDYCYSISKLLTLIHNNYNTLQKLLNLSSSFDQIEFFSVPIFKKQVFQGWEMCSKILETPSRHIEIFYALEEGIGKSINIKKDDDRFWTCELRRDLHSNVKIKPLNNIYDNSWLYYYGYWLRRGYTVNEVVGKYYSVVEPTGREYIIDSNSCSCDYGIQDKRCLHLQMIEWYRQAKSLRISK